ncbi:hypothetical protein MDIS_00380 [Mesomycoplasma dispar]|nr:hypothetical protein MDIS_00380 [Mesomycoplasma dispar]
MGNFLNTFSLKNLDKWLTDTERGLLVQKNSDFYAVFFFFLNSKHLKNKRFHQKLYFFPFLII